MTARDLINKKLKKKIRLPQLGEEVEISKLNAHDAPFLEKRVAEESEAYGRKVSRFIILEKIGPICGLRVVDKVSDPEKELSISELDQDDINFIAEAVLDFSGMTKRGEEARKTFPAEGQNGSQRPPSGQSLSGETSNGAVEAPDGRVVALA